MLQKDRMTMKRFALAVAALLATNVAIAQIYQWKDANGKTVFSDLPPPGNANEQRKISSEAPAATAPTQKTTADRELEFRKRRQESEETAEKARKEQEAANSKKETCESARRQLQALESGERIALRDDKGERYFLDDEQREREVAKARQAIQSSCQ
jgi:hypothetical protein